MKSVLFVCTGNVFRSVSAKYSFEKYLQDNRISGWQVSSAGTLAPPESVDPTVLATLESFGIDASSHTQTRLSRDLLDAHDAVIGMAQDHLDFMKREFGFSRALLFNDLAIGEETSIWDLEDEIPDYLTNRPAVEEKLARTVRQIHDATPALYKNVNERFYLFEDFAKGAVTHRNGYPFITLFETPLSLAFMSIDIPQKEDGHILVIPKIRYVDVADIPARTLSDLTSVVRRVGSALMREHDGYNVLLNNGRAAGQFMMHAHFHLIPRRQGDGIQMETWKHAPLSEDEFLALNERLKQQMAKK
jgi:diadenosine tetraphosphate (Ap4A) HIT family hydrolase/protein-tyrosine-phosphatase